MYDLIIIGAGSAGISAYKEAVKHTDNLLIINDGPWDTTCARVGCMPSKVLISTANRMYDIQHSDNLGLVVDAKIDTQQVMTHVQNLRDRFTKATLKDVNAWPEKHKISGRAHFIDAETIEVNGQQLKAKHFILAVGSTPQYDAELKQQLGDRLLTSDEIFELPQLPQSIAVIGSGVIAIELAQAMHRLGVKTDIFARSRKVGALSSPNLQKLAQETLSQELNLHFETLPKHYQKQDAQVHIEFEKNGTNQTIDVDYVLSATGRRSLLSSLKLNQINPQFEDLKKLPVDAKTKQLADLPIFIVGDAHTQTPLQHEASHEGREAAKNCLKNQELTTIKTLTPLGIVFCDPEMASVGQNYKQLTDASISFVTGMVDYTKQGRALTMGKNRGSAEIYICKESRKILGAEFFCPAAEHFAHTLAWLISENVTVDDVLAQPFYHPTLEEGLRTALKHARRQLPFK